MDAAKRAGGGEAGVKAAVASNQPTTGSANATIDKASVEASKAAFKPAPTPAKLKASLMASKLHLAELGSADKLLGDQTPAEPRKAVPGAGLAPKQEHTD